MSHKITLIEKLLDALGYCEEEDFECLNEILIKKFQDLLENNNPRLKYLKAIAPNFGENDNELTGEQFENLYNSLMEESSRLGVPEAQYETGNRLYEVGRYEEAVDLYYKSAMQGYPPAQFSYGLDLYNGVGLERDQKQGLEFITRSAGRLNTYALEFLINLYAKDTSSAGRNKHELYILMLKWCDKI